MDPYRKEATSWPECIRQFTYKPNWRFTYYDDFTPMVQIDMRVMDSRQPAPDPRKTVVVNQKLSLPPRWHGEEYALDFIRSVIRKMEDHEVDEWIRYRGELVFDPHKEDQ